MSCGEIMRAQTQRVDNTTIAQNRYSPLTPSILLKLTSDQMLKRRVERVIKNDFYDFGSTSFALALAYTLRLKIQ